eukprot:TRINITY_DN1593_c0_g1_i2.p1 TRINITY_DN1593_c0_g1~~TRINITY_DN1593_c0_g1_i2.p1  ORF type:complete len:112 (-),score=23.67 TRINITY_DN1593_c0_g1_i2:209-544(-)
MKTAILVLAVIVAGVLSCGINPTPIKCSSGCQAKKVCSSCWDVNGVRTCFRCFKCQYECVCNNNEETKKTETRAVTLSEAEQKTKTPKPTPKVKGSATLAQRLYKRGHMLV